MKSYIMREQCEECSAPDMAENIHLLANVYTNMGRKKEAIDLYKKVLIMREEAQGKAHPDYAATLCDYGLLVSEKNTEEAIALYEEALSIQKAALGISHPEYLQSKKELEELNKAAETSMRE